MKCPKCSEKAYPPSDSPWIYCGNCEEEFHHPMDCPWDISEVEAMPQGSKEIK